MFNWQLRSKEARLRLRTPTFQIQVVERDDINGNKTG